jgi:16S rRNA (cytosine1402-N4)-methyltransferase
VQIKHGSYSSAVGWVSAQTLDGVLLDLGVSSPQLDTAGRGFSLQTDGPLDMRMDPSQELTAAQVVNEWSEEDLADAIWRFGGERDSRRIARAIVGMRRETPMETTEQLSALVEEAKRRGKYKKHPALKVFQAIRIVVNDELGELNRGLEMAYQLLKSGGRLAVITFHSLEDRMVKDFGNEKARAYDVPGERDIPLQRIDRDPQMSWLKKKSIKPSVGEVKENPRARSAQLRVLEKV